MSTKRSSRGISGVAIALALVLACPAASAGEGLDPGAAGGNDQPRLQTDTRLPMGPILLGGFSLVLVATGAGFGWQASEEHDDWKAARSDPAYAADPDAGQARVDELADDVRAHSITANVLLFSGAALAVVSILWWALRADPEDEPATATAWRVGCGPGFTSLEISF
jgi:hypothetical protein